MNAAAWLRKRFGVDDKDDNRKSDEDNDHSFKIMRWR